MQPGGARPLVNIGVLKCIIPSLSYTGHKGDNGRIGVIGGSLEYTGAPYFAGIAAMKAGADLGHIFCPEEAAIPIKSYSPELIVHPLLSNQSSKVALDSITFWFPRLHSLVIGPGLGRDPAILQTVKELIQEAKRQQKNLIIDADGLYLVTNEPDIIADYPKAILTPNGAEFPRLYNKVLGRPLNTPLEGNLEEETRTLASKLGGVTILRKGQVDIISNGTAVIHCRESGSPRRCGGQGDILAGVAATFLYWAVQVEQKLDSQFGLTPTLAAGFSSCVVTRRCSSYAYRKKLHTMLASDMLDELLHALTTI